MTAEVGWLSSNSFAPEICPQEPVTPVARHAAVAAIARSFSVVAQRELNRQMAGAVR
jgi:hypothetical protein